MGCSAGLDQFPACRLTYLLNHLGVFDRSTKRRACDWREPTRWPIDQDALKRKDFRAAACLLHDMPLVDRGGEASA
jgi:hypothetical protein